MSFELTVNGVRRVVTDEPVHRSLLGWLRATGLTGTKEGCAEGDCGACTVVVVDRGAEGKPTYRAINACIALLPTLAGREVWTVEGLAGADSPIGATLDALHPVQRAMVEHYGSQCGYCTPGFVMSMFEGYYRNEKDPAKLGEQLHGNLCRCTGYRPIRDAMLASLEAPRRPDDLFQLRLKKDVPALGALEHEARGERFFRPTTIDALCKLLVEHEGAELVAGATEIGVEINKKARAFPILIATDGVAELARVWRTKRGWHVGGAATLTQIEEALAGELPAIDKMLRVFASRQIRHRATLAGNVVTASPIGDLPPILLALDAEIVLRSVRGERRVPIDAFFTGYRKTVRARDEVVTEIFWPHTPVEESAGVTRKFETYKVSKRRELDISIVACAFVLDLRDGTIERARLAYGGVAATPMRAKRAEAALVGSKLDEATLARVLPILDGEATPIDDVRSGKDFRRGLIGSLFEKFARGETSDAQEGALGFEPSPPFPTPYPASETPLESLRCAPRFSHHESGIGHVTGGAQYVDDEAQKRGGMLVLWPVTSPHAHARVKSIDATDARAMPGVACVLTAGDIPGTNDVGAVRHDETLLAAAKGEVNFHGHMSPSSSATPTKPAAPRRRRCAPSTSRCPRFCRSRTPSPKAAFTRASTASAGARSIARSRARRTSSAARSISAGRSTSTSRARRHGPSAATTATSRSRAPPSTRRRSSKWSRTSSTCRGTRSSCSSPRMGGGFGGKETQGNAWAALVALAAWKTGRPVRVQLDRDVDMALTGKRHPFYVEYEVAFDDDGKLLALRAAVYNDGGWALDLSESICDRALFHIDNSYFIPNVDVVGRVCKTHQVSHTAFRGFGGPQGMVVVEETIDRVARTLGLLPEVVRARNLYQDGDETHYGQPIENCRLQAIWPALEKSADLVARRERVARFNAESASVKRGIAMTPVKFGISFTATLLNQAGALVLVYRDGTVQVNHGGTEMGQGLYTKMRAVAMRAFGLPEAAVRVMKTRTDKVPNTSATAASSGADLNGQAVKNACDAIKERLVAARAEEARHERRDRVRGRSRRFHGRTRRGRWRSASSAPRRTSRKSA